MPPIAERVGCNDHDTYTPGCFGCWVRNGGGND
jgi:hypothetical protein